MSPMADYMAILTAHTVHICLLPDSSHLTAEDTSPLKPRYFTLGPTTHVTSRSPVVAAVWHPLGVNGSALVTVTRDAVVRVWEISPLDRWSFDAPTLAIDLKRLADGTFVDQDYGAPGTTTNKTFSPDSFDMEVAAASFGSRSSGGWSSMTLWVAMRNGDVYALCPLLPQRWAPPPTLIPALSVSVIAKIAVLEDDAEAAPQTKLLAQQQLEWMSEVDNQEPKIVETAITEDATEIYTRPARPGTIPRLQGPFDLSLDPDADADSDEDIELCDIFAIGEKTSTKDLTMGEDDDLFGDVMDEEGLSLSTICLLTTSGKLKVCLDLEGVQAQWLPARNRPRAALDSTPPGSPSLLLFQSIELLRRRERTPENWSTFSPDVTSRYSFFVTHPFGITYLSLSPWVFRLEQELQADSEERADFRIELLATASSTRERVYTHPQEGPLAACVAIRDPDLGYFLLSAAQQGAVAVEFETPDDEFRPPARATQSPSYQTDEEEPKKLDFNLARPAFQTPDELNERSELERAKGMLFSSRHQFLKNQEVRLSPATLEVLTNVHRLVGTESGRLNRAAAQLFNKLESLPAELQEQVLKANLVKQRIEKISGEDVEPDQPVSDQVRLQMRLQEAKKRQETLVQRMEKLKRMTHRATGRVLSDKERGWQQEVRGVEASIDSPGKGEASPLKGKPLWKRLEEIQDLKAELAGQAEAVRTEGEAREGEALRSSVSGLKVPVDIRREKYGKVMQLLDREAALVTAVKDRLERLALG